MRKVLATAVTFAVALEALKDGKCARRANWPSSFLFVERGAADFESIKTDVPGEYTYINGIQATLFDNWNASISTRNPVIVCDYGEEDVKPYAVMTDELLAEDWEVFAFVESNEDSPVADAEALGIIQQ